MGHGHWDLRYGVDLLKMQFKAKRDKFLYDLIPRQFIKMLAIYV